MTLWESPRWEAMCERVWSDCTGRGSLINREISETGPRISLLRPVESDRTLMHTASHTALHTASHLGLSDSEKPCERPRKRLCERPCSDSLAPQTLTDLSDFWLRQITWQIVRGCVRESPNLQFLRGRVRGCVRCRVRGRDQTLSHWLLIGLDRSVRESEVRSANQIAGNRFRESDHTASHTASHKIANF